MLLSQLRGAATRLLVMTQADLADMLGTTRQSLNIELKRLERDGMIGLGRGRIEIRDRARLLELAGDPD